MLTTLAMQWLELCCGSRKLGMIILRGALGLGDSLVESMKQRRRGRRIVMGRNSGKFVPRKFLRLDFLFGHTTTGLPVQLEIMVVLLLVANVDLAIQA